MQRFAVVRRPLWLAEPAFDGLGRPRRLLVLMACSAGIRAAGPGGQIRARQAQAMVATRVNDHVGLLRHMTIDALRAGRTRRVVMVLGTVVVLRLQAGETRRWRLGVALLTEAVAFDLDLGGVRIVAIGTGHPCGVHFALGERAIDVHLALDLPIGMVEIGP
ncbi:hypothetical protein D3C72_1244050 [compost metagenome]